jgi:hypothetical protein
MTTFNWSGFYFQLVGAKNTPPSACRAFGANANAHGSPGERD